MLEKCSNQPISRIVSAGGLGVIRQRGKEDGSLFESHGSYTGYLPPLGTRIKIGGTGQYVNLREITDRHWGKGNYSQPVPVKPTSPKEKSDENGS